MGKNCYKIRLKIKSKHKGKSGGLRVISHVLLKVIEKENNEVLVFLLTIYDKSEFDNITDKDLKEFIKIY